MINYLNIINIIISDDRQFEPVDEKNDLEWVRKLSLYSRNVRLAMM